MTIKQQAQALEPWYHNLELAPGFIPKHSPYEHIWAMINDVLDTLSYKDLTVLDLGTMDGKWAFYAENRGAKAVIAADIWCNPRFMFAHQVFRSKVHYFTAGDVQDIVPKILPFMDMHGIKNFNIIHYMGVAYHIQNPWTAILQLHRLLDTDGVLVYETATTKEAPEIPILRLNRDTMLYPDDNSTYWMPNKKCLKLLLELSGFRILTEKDISLGITERTCYVCAKTDIKTSAFDFGSL